MGSCHASNLYIGSITGTYETAYNFISLPFSHGLYLRTDLDTLPREFLAGTPFELGRGGRCMLFDAWNGSDSMTLHGAPFILSCRLKC